LAVLVHVNDFIYWLSQGIVWESISLSQVPHFRLGGSIHLITNNQVAFTAEAHIGRSTMHCTDIAKSFEYPVIHVNGDHPEVKFVFVCIIHLLHLTSLIGFSIRMSSKPRG
uniref:E1_dh domain-containing protein n=1 Tax=Haemonchus placei TaxID=6290 RepID=A0A0N4VVX6_HAEPC